MYVGRGRFGGEPQDGKQIYIQCSVNTKHSQIASIEAVFNLANMCNYKYVNRSYDII